MQFGDLHFYGTVFGANVAHAFDLTKSGNIDGVGVCAGGERHHVFRASGGDQFAGTAESDLFAIVHDGDAFAEPLGFVHVVRGEKDGTAGGFELLDQIPKLAAGLRVEAGGGFIEKQKIGIANKRASQSEALLLAAGKIADAGILFFFELDERDSFVRAGSPLKKASEQAKRFEHGQFFGKLRILQLNAEALAELLGIGLPMHAKKFHFASVGSGETFADFDGCGFARAIGPEEAEALAGAYFEIEAVDGHDVLISLAKTRYAKGWLGNDRGHASSIASEKETCNRGIEGLLVIRILQSLHAMERVVLISQPFWRGQ
jgi:hypothetical protein